MQGSGIGNIYRVNTWGESHGKALGVVIDGMPAGLALSETQIQEYLDRRRPGKSPYSTFRKESDEVDILSGVFEGRTTGSPISMMVKNNDARSGDYENIKKAFRPGHADYTFDSKYGFRDYRGGGRSSGRETLSRVCAGAVAAIALKEFDIEFVSYVKSIGNVSIEKFDINEINNNHLNMPDSDAAKKAGELLDSCIKEQNSVGSVVECIIKGVPAGLGDPVFEKLDARLAQAVMSVGSVKGVEIGLGFDSSTSFGSDNNDGFEVVGNKINKTSNNAGGILGGISDGSDIVIRAACKPTPSISRSQNTVIDGQNSTIEIHGRHDPVIGPRAVVVIESMAAITIFDALLSNMSSKMDNVLKFYKDIYI